MFIQLKISLVRFKHKVRVKTANQTFAWGLMSCHLIIVLPMTKKLRSHLLRAYRHKKINKNLSPILKPGRGQNIAQRVFPSAGVSAVLISSFHLVFFTHKVVCGMNSESDFAWDLMTIDLT